MSFLEPLETAVIKPLKEFAKDSIRLVKRCEKPDRKGVRWFQSGMHAQAQPRVIAGAFACSRRCRRG